MQILIIFLNSVFVMPIKMALSYLKKGKPVQAFNVIFVSSPYGFIPFIILGIYTKLWIGLLSCILFMVVGTWCRYRMMVRYMEHVDWKKASDMSNKMMVVFDENEDEDGNINYNKISDSLIDVMTGI